METETNTLSTTLITPEDAAKLFGTFSPGQLKTAIRQKKVSTFRGTRGKKLVTVDSVKAWIRDTIYS